jgi:hypothetical protein
MAGNSKNVQSPNSTISCVSCIPSFIESIEKRGGNLSVASSWLTPTSVVITASSQPPLHNCQTNSNNNIMLGYIDINYNPSTC